MSDRLHQITRAVVRVAPVCIGIILALGLFALPLKGEAAPEPEITLYVEIDNAGLGFSYQLPASWTELPSVLTELYNSAANNFGGGDDAPYLVAAYSSQGSRFIPPVLFIHYLEQPITAGMLDAMNNLFLDEARDEAGKTKAAQKLGLATAVRFIEARELRPGTPLAVMEADSRFGFTVKIMAAPFYLNHGMLVVTYLAPLSDFAEKEAEALNILRSIRVHPAALPR